MKQALMSALVSLLATAAGLFAYDRWVAKPAQVIGVVDISEVFRAKEAEFAAMLTASKTDEERRRAHEDAKDFGDRLDRALKQLPSECRCMIVVKSAVAGVWSNSVDLTPALKAKVGAKL